MGKHESKQIPPKAIIIDTILNLVGAPISGHSKRTQYYSFIDIDKGNSLQQPYLSWFAKQVLEPLKRSEKDAILAGMRCDEDFSSLQANSDRHYRGILITDKKIALAESRLARCKGWFEEIHRDTTLLFWTEFDRSRILRRIA